MKSYFGIGPVVLLILAGAVMFSGCEEIPAGERDSGEVLEIGTEGFFRLAQRDGVWWMLSPEDEEMVTIGVNHLEPVLITSENNIDHFATKYGEDLRATTLAGLNGSRAAAAWVDDSITQIQGWGFNTLGVHNPVVQRRMPYVAKFRPAPIDGWAKHERRYPDPFDPLTEEILEERAELWCAENADDPLIMGVSFNDMTIWRSGPLRLHEWVRAIMEMGADSPGKQKWIEILKSNYPGPRAAAMVYGVSAETWDDLEKNTQWPVPSGRWKAFVDEGDFLPLIADAWYGAETRAIRRCDKNHLIFGDKFEGKLDLPSWLYPIIGRHFDLTYIQWYASAWKQEYKLKEIHEATGKPILMGDSTFSLPNENVPWPKGIHKKSQAEVGEAYAEYLNEMMDTPYVVGWHLCGYIEGSPDLAKYHPYIAIQAGIVRPDGTPYEEIVSRIAAANGEAHHRHSKAEIEDKRGSWRFRTNGRKGAKRCTTAMMRGFNFSQVDNNIFTVGNVAVGKSAVPNKNVGFVVTDEGVVVIDTAFEKSALVAKGVLRQITDKPIKYIIFTHHHGTQIGGAPSLMEEETRIIAHEYLVQEFDLIKDFQGYNRRRDGIQFNLPTRNVPEDFEPQLPYPDITFFEEHTFELGGTRFEIFHAEGEAPDYAVVWMPKQRVVWTADLVGGAMPLVASPMKRVRDEVRWRRALERIRDLKPQVVIPSVGAPVCGEKAVQKMLSAGIDYLNFLHDSVAREMNAGSTLEETLANTTVPQRLKENPMLRELYGRHSFNVAGLYHRYSGWFDQNGTTLNPAPRRQRGNSFVNDMGGERAVMDRARGLARAGDIPLALEYLDVLLEGNPDSAKGHQLKSELLMEMALLHRTHHMTRNMYLKLSAIESSKK